MDEKQANIEQAWNDDGPSREIEERGYRARVIPLLILHKPTLPVDTHNQVWLTAEQRATQWLDLLYDLVIVAILTVFTSTHEVSSGQSLLVYFSYFIIIWWIWASQVHYDVRFQANDWLHRIFKFVQLGAFAFVGVTAKYFDPTNVIEPADATGANAVRESEGSAAWRGVAIAYAIGRVIMTLQYLYVMWTTRNYKRHIGSLLVPALASLLSALLWAISAGLEENAAAKVSLGYIGLGIEYITALLLPLSNRYMKAPAAAISERYGALTLIIIGEGIIGVVRSFSAVVAGFGFSTIAYGEAFCALVIISAAWHFLFHGFNTEVRMGRKSGVMWLVVHMPVHLIILLLLSGMRNAATYSNISHAVDVVQSNVDTLVDGLINNNFSGSAIPMDYLTIQLAKLNVQPTFPVEVQNLENEFLDPNTTLDPFVDLLQYETQVILAITDFYYVKLGDDVLDLRDRIYDLNTTWNPLLTDDERAELYSEDEVLLDEFLNAYGTEIARGVLFFLPCAGGLLFLNSVLNLLRVPPLGVWMWASWAVQACVAVGLCLLGFLDLGNQEMDVDAVSEIPVYRVLDANWILPIAALAYGVLILVDGVMMALAQRAECHARPQPPAPPRSSTPVSAMEPVTAHEHERDFSEKHSDRAGSDPAMSLLEPAASIPLPDTSSSRVAAGSHHTVTP